MSGGELAEDDDEFVIVVGAYHGEEEVVDVEVVVVEVYVDVGHFAKTDWDLLSDFYSVLE